MAKRAERPGRKPQIAVSLSSDVLAALDARAKHEMRSRAQMVDVLLRQALFSIAAPAPAPTPKRRRSPRAQPARSDRANLHVALSA